MVIVVTGKIGIGKSTICEKVVKTARSLGYSCGGILTYKTQEKGIIVVDVQTGQSKALASVYNIYDGPRVGKYFFDPEGLKFGIKALHRGISCDILFVDEVGYLELRGGGFASILEQIATSKMKDSVLVIRKELLPAFSPRLDRLKLLVLEATSNNRNKLPQKICSLLCRNSPALSTRSNAD